MFESTRARYIGKPRRADAKFNLLKEKMMILSFKAIIATREYHLFKK